MGWSVAMYNNEIYLALLAIILLPFVAFAVYILWEQWTWKD